MVVGGSSVMVVVVSGGGGSVVVVSSGGDVVVVGVSGGAVVVITVVNSISCQLEYTKCKFGVCSPVVTSGGGSEVVVVGSTGIEVVAVSPSSGEVAEVVLAPSSCLLCSRTESLKSSSWSYFPGEDVSESSSNGLWVPCWRSDFNAIASTSASGSICVSSTGNSAGWSSA